MNDRERAERLARAIDDFLKGDHLMEAADTQPAGMEEEEIAALLRIARTRMDEASAAAHASIKYEGAIWQQVLHRLDRRSRSTPERLPLAVDLTATAEGVANATGQAEDEFGELADVVRLRREMSERAVILAQAHKDAVWQQVQSRILARSRRQGLSGFLRRSQKITTQAAPDFYRRDAALPKTHDGSTRRLWPRLVTLGAAAAIIVAAIGPVPATGLAGHPAAEFARMVGRQIGVTEADAPPPAPGEVVTIQGTDANAAEAAAQLRLAVADPTTIPSGFELTSSRVFASGVTASDGGMFVLTYASTGADSASLAIYQEHASGSDFAAPIGHAFDVSLGDGTPATYVEGFWQPVDGAFAWSDGDGQALIFDKDGVRSSIQYSGLSRDPAFLFAIADSLIGR